MKTKICIRKFIVTINVAKEELTVLYVAQHIKFKSSIRISRKKERKRDTRSIEYTIFRLISIIRNYGFKFIQEQQQKEAKIVKRLAGSEDCEHFNECV